MTVEHQPQKALMAVLFTVGGLVLLPLGIVRVAQAGTTSTVVGVLFIVGSILTLVGGVTLLVEMMRERRAHR